jgi:hypothetical protein
MRLRRVLGVAVVALLVVVAGCSGGGGPGAGGDGGDGAGSADWCQQGSSYSYTNPQTGDAASMNIEGIVQHEGRQTCKAVWQSEASGGQGQTQIARMELYFTEDSEYTHVIMYDADGNELYEVETTPSG